MDKSDVDLLEAESTADGMDMYSPVRSGRGLPTEAGETAEAAGGMGIYRRLLLSDPSVAAAYARLVQPDLDKDCISAGLPLSS